MLSNLWNTIKAVLKENLIAPSSSIKKIERSYTISLAAHVEPLGQKEANIPKRSRQQEIIKFRDEINQVETEELYKESTKPGYGSLRKLTRDKP